MSDIKDIIPNIKFRVLEIVMQYILKTFVVALKKIKTMKADQKQMLSLSIERVIRNHNIWIYTDSKFFDNSIRKNILSLGKDYVYNNGQEKRKYQPMLRSLSKLDKKGKTVKPLTLEIRMIPNYMVVYHSNMLDIMLTKIDGCLSKKRGKKISIYKKNIIKTHKDICELYREHFLNKEKKRGVNTDFVLEPSQPQFRPTPASRQSRNEDGFDGRLRPPRRQDYSSNNHFDLECHLFERYMNISREL